MADSGSRGSGTWRFVAAGLLVAAVAGGYLAYRAGRGKTGPYSYQPTSAPTTRATDRTDAAQTRATSKPKSPTTTFIDVVRATYPKYPATRSFFPPVRDLGDAARIRLTDPVYLAPPVRADLWITRSDAPPMAKALALAADRKLYPQVHVVPQRVLFVHWIAGERSPVPMPYVVCPRVDGAAGFDVVSQARRESVASERKYDWARASPWNEKVIVPSAEGVSIFRFEPQVSEDYKPLIIPAAHPRTSPATTRAVHAAPQTLLDWQGVLAWVPAENGQPGSRGAARYVNDKWVDLGPDQGWPAHILHLVPLRDGSVLQIVSNPPDGTVRLTLAVLDKVEADEQKIVALVEQMSDPDPDKRESAFKELSQFGRAIYPVLEKLAPDQPPEARARLRTLMRGQVQPTLGGMSLLGIRLHVVTRQPAGGVVLFAPDGVTTSRDDGQTARHVPAWLSVRPGYAAELIDTAFVRELQPDTAELLHVAGEWVVLGDAAGPRRWVGNGFVRLLRKDESEFSRIVGVDKHGRWLFRKPKSNDAADATEETLILDPTLPDPIPRLPFWEYTTAREFGWDADDWPTVRREGGDWSLRTDGWQLLNAKKKQTMLTVVRAAKTTASSTAPSTTTTTTSTRPETEPPILVDVENTRYYGGLTALRAVKSDGTDVTWPLPPEATGTDPPVLLRTPDGLLFLFNQPGRVLRIRPTPEEAEPFTLDATFTRKIPSVSKPKRIWLDPAGRIVIVDARRMLLFFPQGFIPPAIRDLMPLERSELQQ